MLLCQRGKAPHAGEWTFPGGSLELGETMAAAACRELLEETGLVAGGPLPPTPFASTDSITRDSGGLVEFHYVLCHLALTLSTPGQEPQALSDAAALSWVSLDDVVAAGEATPPGSKIVIMRECGPVAREAARHFGAIVLAQP